MVGCNWDYETLVSMVDIFSVGLWLSSIGRKRVQSSSIDVVGLLFRRRVKAGGNVGSGGSLVRHGWKVIVEGV